MEKSRIVAVHNVTLFNLNILPYQIEKSDVRVGLFVFVLTSEVCISFIEPEFNLCLTKNKLILQYTPIMRYNKAKEIFFKDKKEKTFGYYTQLMEKLWKSEIV